MGDLRLYMTVLPATLCAIVASVCLLSGGSFLCQLTHRPAHFITLHMTLLFMCSIISEGMCQGGKPGTGKLYTDVCLCCSAHTSGCVVDGLGATAAFYYMHVPVLCACITLTRS